MEEPLTKKEIEQMIELSIKNYMSRKQYNISKVPNHEHTGVDINRIDPKNLLGFPIVSVAPTADLPEGTIRLYRNSSTYRIYCRINNLWKYANLS